MTPADRLQTIQEYYFSQKLREVKMLQAQGKPIINMGVGSPDLLPSKRVVQAIQQAVVEPNAHQYQSYIGLPEFRSAITDFYNRFFNVSLNTEKEILPLMGSKEGILHISLAFLNLGDKVLIPNPGYPTYASVTKLVGATPVFYELDAKTNWLPNLEELEKTDLSKVKMMWISYPHMPTGAKANKKFYQDLVSFATRNSILLINDNPYSFILNDTPTSILSVKGAKEVALELNSLSKSFNMAGWRVGMLLGNEQFLKEVLKVKTQQDSGMFYGIQKGAIEALKTNQLWFDSINEIYKERRKLIWKFLDKLGCSYKKDSVGMFVWAKIPLGISSEEMTDKLLYEKSIFVASGTVFGSKGEGYIRLSLCVEKNQIKEAISRL